MNTALECRLMQTSNWTPLQSVYCPWSPPFHLDNLVFRVTTTRLGLGRRRWIKCLLTQAGNEFENDASVWKPAKLYEKPDHLCMNEASRRGPHCNFWLPCNDTPSEQQEGCISHSFLYMNSPINWGAYYHLQFIVIVNFVAAEWNKTQQLGTSS